MNCCVGGILHLAQVALVGFGARKLDAIVWTVSDWSATVRADIPSSRCVDENECYGFFIPKEAPDLVSQTIARCKPR